MASKNSASGARGRMQVLSEESCAAIRAGQIIGSVTRAVEELIRNAVIHGRAKNVIVTIGNKRTNTINNCATSTTSFVQVQDDGIGIDAMSLEHFVGTHHCSSSFDRSRTTAYGHHKRCSAWASTTISKDDFHSLLTSYYGTEHGGESLKALAALSVEMRIKSYARQADKLERNSLICSRKVLRGGKVVEYTSIPVTATTSSPPGVLSNRQAQTSVTDTGTIVSLYGLFHTHIVRKLQYEREHADVGNVSNTNNITENDKKSITTSITSHLKSLVRTSSILYPHVNILLENGNGGRICARWSSKGSKANSRHAGCDTNSNVDEDVISVLKHHLRQIIAGRCIMQAPFATTDASINSSNNDRDYLLGHTILPIQFEYTQEDGTLQKLRSCLRRSDSGACAKVSTKTACMTNRNEARTSASSRCTKAGASNSTLSTSATKNTWRVLGVVCRKACELDQLRCDGGATSAEPETARRSSYGFPQSKNGQMAFINGRPAHDMLLLSSIMQESLQAYKGSGLYFIIHIFCPTELTDHVLQEHQSVTSIKNVELLKEVMYKAISSQFSHRQPSSCRDIVTWNEVGRNERREKLGPSTFCDQYSRDGASRLICGSNVTCASKESFHIKPSQHIVDVDTEKADECGSHSDCKGSPFSLAFLDSALCSKSVSPSLHSSAINFEDAFMEQSNLEDSFDDSFGSISHLAEMENKSENSLQWTKTRIQVLETEISSLMCTSTSVSAVQSSSQGSLSITKEMLSKAAVVAQLDAKFIIINAQGLLCVVDQHAADERVRLESSEQLLSRQMHQQECSSVLPSAAHLNSETADDIIKTIKLSPPKHVTLTPDQLSLVVQHRALLTKWRFATELPPTQEKSILLHSVPSVCQKEATQKDLLQFLHALACCTSDASTMKPPFVKRVLASHACRYAIMFGDVLTHDRCCELIRSLSECEFSFICAHGRPSVIPLIDLKSSFPGKEAGEDDTVIPPAVSIASQRGDDITKIASEIPLRFNPRRLNSKKRKNPV